MPTFIPPSVAKENQRMKNIRKALLQRGFTLIELTIVLAIAGVLFVGLWRLLAGGNQQIKDSTAATQQQQLIDAVKAFLASPDGQDFMTKDGSGADRTSNAFPLPLPTNPAGNSNCKTDPALVTAMGTAGSGNTKAETWCNLLPPGFSQATVNSYGQNFKIGILREAIVSPIAAPRTYSFMILTQGGDPIPDSSGGRISAQIGSDGGFIYTGAVCTAAQDNNTACGAYGGWTAKPSAYSLTNLKVGVIASRTYSSPEYSSQQQQDVWLARRLYPNSTSPNFDYNTMSADMFMGTAPSGSPSQAQIITTAAGSRRANIYMQGGTIDLGVGAAAAGSSSLVNGKILATFPFAMSGGYDMSAGLNPGPFIDIKFPPGSWPTGSNTLVQIFSNCTSVDDNISRSDTVVPHKPNCAPALNVQGEGYIAYLNAGEIFSNVFFYQSDRNVKNSIKPIKGALETLMKIKPVSFKFNGTQKISLGVIAQDIEEIYPGMVSQHGANGTKGVAYHELIAPMIESIQELKRQNDDLRKDLGEQRHRQDLLEKELSAAKAR